MQRFHNLTANKIKAARRKAITGLAAVAALSTLSTGAWAQNVPPKELQVSRIFCNQFPGEGQAVVNQLPAGGKWEKINPKSFVYGVRSLDALTGRANEYRYMFVREDSALACGDTPCATLTRVAQNGFELRPYQFNQFCTTLLMNVAMSGKGVTEALEAEAGKRPPSNSTRAAPTTKPDDRETLTTVAGPLHVLGSFMLLDGRELFNDQEAKYFDIEGGWPKPGPAKYALINVTSGGTACPALFRIADVSGASPIVTEKFGSCSDIPKTSFEGDTLRVDFPAFRDAPAESYQYQTGKLTKVK